MKDTKSARKKKDKRKNTLKIQAKKGLKTVRVLHLYKQNFKFSAAHFLIFDEKRAERLHGHNYQVRVSIKFNQDVHELGYLVDFNLLKKQIKSRLDQWDEMVLIPAKNSEMKISYKFQNIDINFRDRFYSFPKNEVVLLDIVNTSVELLSELLAHDFYEDFKSLGVKTVQVSVEETRGQGASAAVGAIS